MGPIKSVVESLGTPIGTVMRIEHGGRDVYRPGKRVAGQVVTEVKGHVVDEGGRGGVRRRSTYKNTSKEEKKWQQTVIKTVLEEMCKLIE